MTNNNWEIAYYFSLTLIGQKVKVDKIHEAIVRMVFGGPLEIFFVVANKDNIFYIDAYDQTRMEIIP